MAIAFSHYNPPISGYSPYPNPASVFHDPRQPNCAGKTPKPANLSLGRRRSRRSWMVVAISNGGHNESLAAPLKPSSPTGEWLRDVLLHYPDSFYDTVLAELTDLAKDRDDAFARMELSSGKPDASLHRKIAEQKQGELLPIIEDIMHMIICRRFKDIKVPLIQSIDTDIRFRKLELSPSIDKELESIHSPEELEVVQVYLTNVLESNFAGNSGLLKMATLHLFGIYSNAISNGCFLKSVSIRHRLDRSLSNRGSFLFGSGFNGGVRNVALGELSTAKSAEMRSLRSSRSKPYVKLKSYLQGLDEGAVRVCKEMRSQISLFLMHDHNMSLFSDGDAYTLDYTDSLMVSTASLKRLVLEALAFGCFLWEAEDYVDRVFNLRKVLKPARIV